MKKLLIIPIVLLSASALAEPVNKCKLASGKVVYQNQECPAQADMQEINIQTLDSSIIENAQKKLQQDLETQAAQDAEQATQEIEQRKLQAVEQYNSSEPTNYFQTRSSRNTNLKNKPVDY